MGNRPAATNYEKATDQQSFETDSREERGTENGISLTDHIPWGTHLCCLYQASDDLIEVLIPYFKTGLENNEFCLWIVPQPVTIEEAREAMGKAMPGFARYVESGQMEIVPHELWYLKESAFDPERVVRGWVDKLDRALAAGYYGMRLSRNAAWPGGKNRRSFAESEIAINRILGEHKIVTLCTYWLKDMKAADLVEATCNHQFTIVSQDGDLEIRGNPFRKQNSAALLKEAELLRSIYEQSPIGIGIYDAAGILISANTAFLDIFGVSDLAEDEVKGFRLFDNPNLSEGVKQRLRNGETVRFEGPFDFEKVREYRLYQTDKKGAIYLDVLLTPIVGGRSPGGYLAQIVDITGRKKAEAALDESKRRNRLLAENVSDVIWATDAKLRIKYVSPAVTTLLGYSVEEAMAGGIVQGLDTATINALTTDLTEAMASDGWPNKTAKLPVREVQIRCRDGSTIWAEARGVLIWGADGQPAEVVGVLHDITKRKKTEEALRESEKRYRLLAENISDVIWVTDLNMRPIYTSPSIERLLGYTVEESMSRGAKDTLTPASLKTAAESLARALSLKEPGAQDAFQANPPDLEFKCKDGSTVWVSTKVSILRDNEGRPYAILGVLHDITERKRSEEMLEHRSKELARSNSELQTFAYVASHDLQEPLRIVSSYVQLLARRYKGKLDADADDFINYTVDGVTRMQTLINDLLAYSRVGTQGKPLQPTDSQEVVNRVITILQKKIEETGAVVTTEPLPVVLADANQLMQVFQNLIGNSLKFHGKQPPRIHISAERRTDEWLFSVRDNGIGIDPQYHERIFTMFQRLHGRDEYEGTGIGLAICKKIIERHGKRIWVESQLGEGATFYFTMPIVGGKQA